MSFTRFTLSYFFGNYRWIVSLTCCAINKICHPCLYCGLVKSKTFKRKCFFRLDCHSFMHYKLTFGLVCLMNCIIQFSFTATKEGWWGDVLVGTHGDLRSSQAYNWEVKLKNLKLWLSLQSVFLNLTQCECQITCFCTSPLFLECIYERDHII